MTVSTLELVDYRRRVAKIYADVLDEGVNRQSWERWRDARTDLLLTHVQSPVGNRNQFGSTLPYFDYDPSWSVIGTVSPLASADIPRKMAEGSSILNQIGWVSFEREEKTHRLGLFWLDAYGGGLMLPFRDTTNGSSTYGAGRYVLDGAKSADLGSVGPDQLVLDFNFAYHPSCMWDPQWACPLAPRSNHLAISVEAGEQMPLFTATDAER